MSALDQTALRAYFGETYAASNLSVVAVGNIEHEALKALMEKSAGPIYPVSVRVPVAVHPLQSSRRTRSCAGRSSSRATSVWACRRSPQNSPDRYVSYALNTVLGGSMSSRLFQNVREKRGLAYAVFSGLSAYQDSGALSIYAGCANEAVSELIDVVVAELRQLSRRARWRRRAAAREGPSERLP